MSSNFEAYPYPIHSMTLNKIDNPTIKISLEFIKEFEKDKTYRTITYDDIKNEKVKEKNIIGHCIFCQNQSPISNSTLEYYDNIKWIHYMCCICCDCVKKYDENNN